MSDSKEVQEVIEAVRKYDAARRAWLRFVWLSEGNAAIAGVEASCAHTDLQNAISRLDLPHVKEFSKQHNEQQSKIDALKTTLDSVNR